MSPRRLSLLAALLPLFYGTLFIQTYAHAIRTSHPLSSMGFVEGNGVAGNAATKGHVPLDVDGYPVAPAELELEQVHIYVRHGASIILFLVPLPRSESASPYVNRRTHTSRCAYGRTSREYPGELDVLQNSAPVPRCSRRCKFQG